MAHFFAPGRRTDGYDVDGKLAPDSVWRIIGKAVDGKELRPDISVGKTFPKWLKTNHPGLADEFKGYSHILPNGVEVEARQYHVRILPAYIEFIEVEWLPNYAAGYFKERDPKALEYLPKLLPPPKKK